MSIGVSDSDYVSFYITNSGTCVENAVSALRSAESAFTLGMDSASAYKCATIINSLSNQARTLHSISSEFENTKEKLNSVDRSSSNTFNKTFDSLGNFGSGSVFGSASAIVGHSASSFSLNALNTFKYRGNASQLHGFAHEVMFADKYNYSLGRELFTKATYKGLKNESGKDVVIKKFGNIVGKPNELKTTKSVSYAKDAIKNNAPGGKYAGSKLLFDKEMAEQVNGNTTGISYSSAKSVANAAKTTSPATLALKTIGKSAASAGVVGAVIDGGIEAVTKFSDWKSGKITGKQYFSGIAKEAAIGGAAGAITGAALATAAVLGVTLTGGTALLAGAVIGGIANWGLHKLFGN